MNSAEQIAAELENHLASFEQKIDLLAGEVGLDSNDGNTDDTSESSKTDGNADTDKTQPAKDGTSSSK